MAGPSLESTIRVMSRWQKDGIIESEHRFITILNQEAVDELLRS